jgi:serine/threonine protein kinase
LEFIHQQTISAEDVELIVRMITTQLHYLRSCLGGTHSDLKLENFVVLEGPQVVNMLYWDHQGTLSHKDTNVPWSVRLLDYDRATLGSGISLQTEEAISTVIFTPPEVVLGSPRHVSHPGRDSYCVGLLLMQLLLKEHPFNLMKDLQCPGLLNEKLQFRLSSWANSDIRDEMCNIFYRYLILTFEVTQHYLELIKTLYGMDVKQLFTEDLAMENDLQRHASIYSLLTGTKMEVVRSSLLGNRESMLTAYIFNLLHPEPARRLMPVEVGKGLLSDTEFICA